MNKVFTAKFLQHLNKKKADKGEKGFTLIELLVVVIIIGVLAAVALPNLLGQVAKGRQAEAKNNLGAINRAQQAHRLEEGTFGTISALPISVDGTYYSYLDVAANATVGTINASATTTFTSDILDYQGEVTQNVSGIVTAVICEQDTLTSDFPDANGTGGCTEGSAID